MINAKEAQQHVYSMFIDGMLTLEVKLFLFVYFIFLILFFVKELSKSSDFNPTRTFYFFRVNLYNGVLSLLDHSYKVYRMNSYLNRIFIFIF